MSNLAKLLFGSLGIWRILIVGYYVYGWTLGNTGSPGSYGTTYPVAVIFGLLFWLLPPIALIDMIITIIRWRRQSGAEGATKLIWSIFVLSNGYVLLFVIK